MASLAHLPASTATLIAALEPAMTAVLAYVLLGEQLSALQLVGGGLVLLAVVAVTLSDRRERERKLADERSLRDGPESSVAATGLGPPPG